jgi:DNA polymerase
MRWSILTPQGSLHWDGSVLEEGPPAQRGDAPQGDPTEDLWRKYYASIFNPARLKIGAMLKEMPRKYWKNMPEAALIPELVAGAQKRESAMVAAGTLEMGERPATLAAIDKAIHACRKCPIGLLDNRVVMGEGPRDAALMFVGEQPGDQEDLAGGPSSGRRGSCWTATSSASGSTAAPPTSPTPSSTSSLSPSSFGAASGGCTNRPPPRKSTSAAGGSRASARLSSPSSSSRWAPARRAGCSARR